MPAFFRFAPLVLYVLLAACRAPVPDNYPSYLAPARYPVLLNMVHHNPGEPHFESEFTQPEFVRALGYTDQVPKIEIQCALTYDDYEDDLVPERSAEKMWILRHAANLRTRLAIAERHGVPVYPFTDVLVLPRSVLDKYEEEMSVDGRLSITRPRTRELLRAQIAELFDRFPTLDGLTVRHGETYLHDTPHHRGSSPARTPAEHAQLINLLREEICVKRGKRLIYRTWDFSQFHTQPDFYRAATDAVEPHPLLLFSIKHVNNDFLRGNPFNRTIGLGRHPQIVEVSVNQAGVYGRGSHPYYIGAGVIDGWTEMADRRGLRDLYTVDNVRGFWTWTWGDGWFGPYFDNPLWVRLNEYVIRAFAGAPQRSEADLFRDYATRQLGLSPTGAAALRELCLLSADAAYYGQDTDRAYVRPWWVRDHFLTGPDLGGLVEAGIADTVLAEQRANLANWYRMEELSRSIRLPSARDQEFLEVSTTYGRIKYELIAEIWAVQVALARHARGLPYDRRALERAVNRYRDKFAEWTRLRKSSPACPTLYVDHAAVHIAPPFAESLARVDSLLRE